MQILSEKHRIPICFRCFVIVRVYIHKTITNLFSKFLTETPALARLNSIRQVSNMATMKDIAKKAGVSTATVSRILNYDPLLQVTDLANNHHSPRL